MITDALQIRWNELVQPYASGEPGAGICFEEIVKRYGARSRQYHTLQHLQSMLALSASYARQLVDREVVDFSIFYHDAVYNVFRKDNEQRSAALAVNRLHMLHLPPTKINQVKVFIEATQAHEVPTAYGHMPDLPWFLDFDIAVLAASREEYEKYTQQVRREYRMVPPPIYRAGRRKFLQQCLQKEFIFHTEEFRSKFEGTARDNITRELQGDDEE